VNPFSFALAFLPSWVPIALGGGLALLTALIVFGGENW